MQETEETGFDPSVGNIPWRRAWQPTPVFLPRESLGQRILAGYRPQGRKRVGHDWSDLALILLNELIFYLMLFLCLGFHPGYLMTLSSHVSLGFPRWCLLCKLSLFLMALTSLGSSGQVFCFSVWICLTFSSRLAWAYGFWGEDPRGKVPSLITSHGGANSDLTHPCRCWPWSSGADSPIKYLLCCVCVILILANLDFDSVLFWFSVCHREVGGGSVLSTVLSSS